MMFWLDKQGRITLGKDVAKDVASEGNEVFFYLNSVISREHIILSSICSDDDTYFYVGKIKMDGKYRIIIPKKVLTSLGWEKTTPLILAKHKGRWCIFRA